MEAIITGNFIGNTNQNIPDTYGGEELAFIKELDFMAFNYCQILSDSAQNAPNTIFSYPATSIGNQFKITSKLIVNKISYKIMNSEISKIITKFSRIING